MDTTLSVSKEVDQALRAAIAGRRLVNFSYQGRDRKAEPHDYGINKGKTRLFCYQVGGESRSGTGLVAGQVAQRQPYGDR